MKNLLPFLILILFCACKADPVEEAIIVQLETIDGIRVDLKTRVLELEALPPVTCADSLEIARKDSTLAELTIDGQLAQFQNFGIDKTREELRKVMIPQWVDEKMAEYAANSDSVLLQPYRAKIRQRIGGLKTEFEQVLYLPPGK